jgi:5-formyltetrahydrofolate cyclo-ligase
MQLLARRERFGLDPSAAQAAHALALHLRATLQRLEPTTLGTYWPMRAEFNPSLMQEPGESALPWPLALPFARRTPRSMAYRSWNGQPPTLHDECGIATGEGAPVLPDVVLVPCVGFTDQGHRLGYGGGYFDRWLAANPGVTAVGVAWSQALIDAADFEPAPHDIALALIVTEAGVR